VVIRRRERTAGNATVATARQEIIHRRRYACMHAHVSTRKLPCITGIQRPTHAPIGRFGAGRCARARSCLAAGATGPHGPDLAHRAPHPVASGAPQGPPGGLDLRRRVVARLGPPGRCPGPGGPRTALGRARSRSCGRARRPAVRGGDPVREARPRAGLAEARPTKKWLPGQLWRGSRRREGLSVGCPDPKFA